MDKKKKTRKGEEEEDEKMGRDEYEKRTVETSSSCGVKAENCSSGDAKFHEHVGRCWFCCVH